jgi:hypothetical protein
MMNLDGHVRTLHQIDEKTYEYIFDKPVNFSRIINPIIECKTEDQTEVAVFAQSLNIACINRDNIEILFSG